MYTAAEIYDIERQRVFEASWLYLGHESEVASPGDYVLRRLGPEEVLLVRREDGGLSLLHNRCAHRGARIVSEPAGNARQLRAANDRWGGYPGMAILAVDYLQAMRIRPQMKRALDDVYSRFDAIATPSRGTVSYPIAMDFDKAYPNLGGGVATIPAGNIAGQPALSVPNGFGETGSPTNFVVYAQPFHEAEIIALVKAYQDAAGFHLMKPSKLDQPTTTQQ